MDKPTQKPARPSLYHGKEDATPASFSVLDAATIQGYPKQRKDSATATPKPTPRPARPSSHFFLIAAGAALSTAGAIWLAVSLSEKPSAPAISVASAPKPAAAPLAAPTVGSLAPAPVPTPVQPIPESKPAVIEEAKAATADTDAVDNPLKELEGSDQPAASASKKAAPTRAAKDAHPAKQVKIAKAQKTTTKASKPAKDQSTGDNDVDFMAAVLDHLGRPTPPKAQVQAK